MTEVNTDTQTQAAAPEPTIEQLAGLVGVLFLLVKDLGAGAAGKYAANPNLIQHGIAEAESRMQKLAAYFKSGFESFGWEHVNMKNVGMKGNAPQTPAQMLAGLSDAEINNLVALAKKVKGQ